MSCFITQILQGCSFKSLRVVYYLTVSSKWGQHFLRFVSIHAQISYNFSSIHSRLFFFIFLLFSSQHAVRNFSTVLYIVVLQSTPATWHFLQNTCQHFVHDAYFVKATQINTICSTAYIHYRQWLLPIRYKTQLDESVLQGMGAGRMMQHSNDWPVPSSNFPILEPEIKDVFCITVTFDSKYFFHSTNCYVLISEIPR